MSANQPTGGGGAGGISESRLDDLRREAEKRGRVEGPGVVAGDGPQPGGVVGYHGRPIVKAPVWTWEIPLYFFVGGMSGMAALIAFVAWSEHTVALSHDALWLAFAGALFSPILLTLDLGRPWRFLKMLRVAKGKSPMSVGVWTLVSFGFWTGVAVLLVLGFYRLGWFGWDPRTVEFLVYVALLFAAFSGALLATYTGVLLGATAIPAWNSHRRFLPLHFGIAGLGSAAAALELLAVARHPEVALGRLGTLAAAAETLLLLWLLLDRHGAADRALHHGWGGWLLLAAGIASGPLALGFRLDGWPLWAAASFLAGALLSRYGWLLAGRASARDPEASLPPRETA